MIQYKKCEAGDEKWVIEIVKQFRNQAISTQKAKDLVNNKNIWIYIAYDNDIVCGYTLSYVLERMDCDSNMLMIYHCFVNDSYWHQHIGQTLMEMVLEQAHHMHYTFLITQDTNEAANGLYQKLGGQLHNENKNVYYWYGLSKPKI